MGKKNGNQNSAEDDAADDFAGTNGESKEPERSGNGIGIAQNQRDNDAVGYNRAECAEEAMLPECISSDRAKKRCQCAEYNIGQSTSGQARRQPMVTPGTAAGVKKGRTVSTSEKRT